jgi:hypothetical protein
MLQDVGPARRVPLGMGATRSHLELAAASLAQARASASYGYPVIKARHHLEDAFTALDWGTGMAPAGTRTTPGTMAPR